VGNKVVDQVSNAVLRIVGLSDDGVNVSEATVKVASDMRLTPEVIRRVAHVVNRANLTSQRLCGEDLPDKLAAVSVIDPQKVIDQIYSTASQEKTASAEDSVRGRIEVGVLRLSSGQNKTAENENRMPFKPANWSAKGMYHGLSGGDLMQVTDKLEQVKRAALRDLSNIEGKVTIELDGLNRKLARYPQVTQLALIDQGRVYFAERDPVAGYVLEALADSLPIETQAKIAFAPQTPDVWHAVVLNSDFLPSVTKYANLIRRLPEIEEGPQKKYADAVARLELIESSLSNGQVDRVGINLGGSFEDLDKQWLETKTADLLAMVGLTAAANKSKGVGSKAGSPTEEDRYVMQLKNPQHEAALSAIRTRSALQSLMSDDPVIKSYEPNKIMAAFNELSQFSPKSVEHSASLRAGLRAALQSNQSLFDLEQFRKSERVAKNDNRSANAW